MTQKDLVPRVQVKKMKEATSKELHSKLKGAEERSVILTKKVRHFKGLPLVLASLSMELNLFNEWIDHTKEELFLRGELTTL